MDIFQWYELSRSRSGTALFPIRNATTYSLSFSTRVGNVLIDKGDGSAPILWSPPKMNDFTTNPPGGIDVYYSTPFTGNISVKFLQGLRDVYSWQPRNSNGTGSQSSTNITDIETFFKQFPNLYSIHIDEYAYQDPARMPIIKGDLAKLPDSVEKVLLERIEILNIETDLVLNFSSYPNQSKLKSFIIITGYGNYAPKIIGDLGKLPPLCNLLDLRKASAGSSITYTAGKVWASNLETLSIPLPLSHTELDNLLIDMQNSVTSVGPGTIALGGYRSSVSDAAVAYLQGLGRTVSIQHVLNNASNADAAILRLDFQNNFDVYSNSGLNIIAGGTSNQPTFALSGRKAGEYCAVFNGSQSIKTTTNLPVNSDKVTIAFWIKKTTPATNRVIYETGTSGTSNLFAGFSLATGALLVRSRTTGNNENSTSISNDVWMHIIAVIDRNENGANEIKTYLNGVLAASTKPNSFDNNGNFLNDILHIGQRAGNSQGFNGSLTLLKIYNYPFTPSEVSTLYNSEL